MGRWCAVIGSGCLLAPVVDFLMIGFLFMHDVAASVSDGALRHDVGLMLVTTAVCSLLSMLGYCLAGIAIFGFRFRPTWLKSNLTIGAVLLLPAFPLGTMFALLAFTFLGRNSQMFTASSHP